jgi:hypothetical protein
MLNTLSITWVKNVYTVGKPLGISSEDLYTGGVYSTINTPTSRVKPSFFTHISNSFTPLLYTLFLPISHLLMDRLYTVSTAPTINKAKEK